MGKSRHGSWDKKEQGKADNMANYCRVTHVFEAGEKLTEKFDTQEFVPSNEISQKFAGDTYGAKPGNVS